MYPVVIRGIEDVLDNRVQAANQGGVNKKLVNQGQRVTNAYPHWIEANQRQWHVKQPAAVEDIGRVLAHRGRKVHALGGVVRYVGSP